MNINEHPIYKAIYELCLEIEKLPASEQATKVVIMAGELEKPVRALIEQRDDAKAAERAAQKGARINALVNRELTQKLKDVQTLVSYKDETASIFMKQVHKLQAKLKQKYASDPEMSFDEELGWMHENSLVMVNELRAKMAVLRDQLQQCRTTFHRHGWDTCQLDSILAETEGI